MTTNDDPPIHVITEDGKLRICFSRFMKVAIGVVSTLVTSLLAGAFVFAWQSNAKLAEVNVQLQGFRYDVDHINKRVDRLDDRVDRSCVRPAA